MLEKVHCGIHGECLPTFVCSHLLSGSVALGFNRHEPTQDKPFPDAWCNNCDLIYKAHGGWTEESEKLVKVELLCSGCYEQSRIRNMVPSVTLDDLKDLRWKCGSCEEWHTGPALDFGYWAPIYWESENETSSRSDRLLPAWSAHRPKTFLDEDFCAIEDEHFYVRGVIHLPIYGTAETLGWGVWGSLSRQNFEKLLQMNTDPKRTELPPMFSWLCNKIPEYPDTLNLKMRAHTQKLGERPHFELEPTDHPLAQEYHHGITPERVKEIMMRRLRGEG